MYCIFLPTCKSWWFRMKSLKGATWRFFSGVHLPGGWWETLVSEVICNCSGLLHGIVVKKAELWHDDSVQLFAGNKGHYIYILFLSDLIFPCVKEVSWLVCLFVWLSRFSRVIKLNIFWHFIYNKTHCYFCNMPQVAILSMLLTLKA